MLATRHTAVPKKRSWRQAHAKKVGETISRGEEPYIGKKKGKKATNVRKRRGVVVPRRGRHKRTP